jgi:hypothetical protein
MKRISVDGVPGGQKPPLPPHTHDLPAGAARQTGRPADRRAVSGSLPGGEQRQNPSISETVSSPMTASTDSPTKRMER